MITSLQECGSMALLDLSMLRLHMSSTEELTKGSSLTWTKSFT